MKRLPMENISQLFQQIAREIPLYIPADTGNTTAFLRYTPGMELSRRLNTDRSAKDLFFPQMEHIAHFKVSGKTISLLDQGPEPEDFVLFGVRPCDARSFDILDSVFLNDPKDSFYEARRKSATVITLACSRPEETCFCTAFGIDPTEPVGDIAAWITEDFLYLAPQTQKGEALFHSLTLLDADEADVAAQQAQTRQLLKKLPLAGLKLEGFEEENMMTLFASPKWAELSQSCLGCGSCTFACPTCQCYDVQEFQNGDTVGRFRCWDSCMYSDFTAMSAGQPRPTQLERFRQRFMHKLCYYPANHNGVYGCVGCGRCLRKCPIHTNIVKVASCLMEDAT